MNYKYKASLNIYLVIKMCNESLNTDYFIFYDQKKYFLKDNDP